MSNEIVLYIPPYIIGLFIKAHLVSVLIANVIQYSSNDNMFLSIGKVFVWPEITVIKAIYKKLKFLVHSRHHKCNKCKDKGSYNSPFLKGSEIKCYCQNDLTQLKVGDDIIVLDAPQGHIIGFLAESKEVCRVIAINLPYVYVLNKRPTYGNYVHFMEFIINVRELQISVSRNEECYPNRNSPTKWHYHIDPRSLRRGDLFVMEKFSKKHGDNSWTGQFFRLLDIGKDGSFFTAELVAHNSRQFHQNAVIRTIDFDDCIIREAEEECVGQLLLSKKDLVRKFFPEFKDSEFIL